MKNLSLFPKTAAKPLAAGISRSVTTPAGRARAPVKSRLAAKISAMQQYASLFVAKTGQHMSLLTKGCIWDTAFKRSLYNAHSVLSAGFKSETTRPAIHTDLKQKNSIPHVALVGAGPGAKDLMTLRAVQRLQQADVVYYDRLLDDNILDFAPPLAQRVYVGKRPGCHPWPQEKISAALVACAQQGKRVVRLKCGDPGIFARGAEEIDALAAAGIEYEIIPGVTAASSAAAAAQTVLTKRGSYDKLILATGHLKEGPQAPDWLSDIEPGSSVALYMGVGSARLIQSALMQNPYATSISITLVANAQRSDQKICRCSVSQLVTTLTSNGIRNTAIIMIQLEKLASPDHPLRAYNADRTPALVLQA